MKLLFLVQDDETEAGLWRDIHIDKLKICAFYMPDIEDDGIKTINLFLGNQLITVVQNNEIIEYLTYKFNL
tara:strand:- start:3243 stop:3455 length:213 start_codon:yes stop_codon:yes gene_type:complete